MAIAAGTLFPLAGWRMTSDMFRAMKLARKSLRCQLLTKMTVICIRQMMLLFAVWPPDFTQRSYFLQTGHSYQPCSSQDRTGQSPASLQVQNPLRKCPFVATSLRPPFQPKLKQRKAFPYLRFSFAPWLHGESLPLVEHTLPPAFSERFQTTVKTTVKVHIF